MKPHQQARVDGKYLFVWDRTNKTSVFYEYMEKLCSIDIAVKQGMSGKDAREYFHSFRTNLIDAMKAPNICAFSLGDTVVDFEKFTHPELLPIATIFNRDQWKADYNAHLLASDALAGVNPDGLNYTMEEDFMIVIVSNAADEATLTDQMKQIPHIDTMNKVTVN